MSEREILAYNRTGTGYGTNHYDVKFKGEWDDLALINCIDIGKTKPTEEEYIKYCRNDLCMNFGGYVEYIYKAKTEDEVSRARVDVYYD